MPGFQGGLPCRSFPFKEVHALLPGINLTYEHSPWTPIFLHRSFPHQHDSAQVYS